MFLTSDIIEQDKIVFLLHKKLEKSRTSSVQRELKRQIDLALDKRLELMENEDEDSFSPY